jgi:hypothetical protein
VSPSENEKVRYTNCNRLTGSKTIDCQLLKDGTVHSVFPFVMKRIEIWSHNQGAVVLAAAASPHVSRLKYRHDTTQAEGELSL